MRRYSANYVYTVCQPPIKNGIVEVDETGVVLNVINPGKEFHEIHSTEFYNGVIVPGFINTHCHLELSHLLNQFSKGLGIAEFIKAVSEQRIVEQRDVLVAIKKSISELERTGIVVVGDICNTIDTVSFKAASKIHFHNFIEIFGINPNGARQTLDKALRVENEFKKFFPNSTSLTPHSTYSLSNALWTLLQEAIMNYEFPISIHFAESQPEYEFLQHGTGPILDRYRLLKVPFDIPSGLSPVKIIFNYIDRNQDLLLIHNTFASIEELKKINDYFRKVTFVTCPESNLFIEGQLPDLLAMHQNSLRIAVGTDSLASASTLSMLNQINLILNSYPEIPFHEVLKWATLNGAEALNVSDIYGSIDTGKRPGLNLITNFDFANMRPQSSSGVKRLV